MTLSELAELLGAYAAGELALDAVQARVAPVLAADPLDVELSDSTPWDHAHDDARLFWRLVYLVESAPEDDGPLRRLLGRLVRCLARTRSAATTFELLPVVADQERFCLIVAKHRSGVISRTGFLSVLAESGYPDHVKLWLERAPGEALARLCERLEAGAYDVVAAAFERPPA